MQCVRVYLLRDRRRLGGAAEQATLAWVQAPAEGLTPDQSFSLEIEAAQTLMDDLWNAGIRPTEGAGSAGAMLATQKHLADMRTLAFHKLGVKP